MDQGLGDQGAGREDGFTLGETGFTLGETGFTLLELMIVVTILSLLTLSVGLGVNRPRTSAAQDWSRFAAQYDQLQAQAVLSQEVLGLAVDAAGYQRLRRTAGGWAEIGARVDWRGPVAVFAPIDRSPLFFTPGGQASPADLRFGAGKDLRRCRSDGWAAVSCAGA